MKIAIVGVGRLGSVFARVLAPHHTLILIDRSPPSTPPPAGLSVTSDLQAVRSADWVILAVKPGNAQEVVSGLPPVPLLVSCAAGISIRQLESWGARNVIRVMPNICIECSEGMIAYASNPGGQKQQRPFESVFSALGTCLRVAEAALDPITALSGSGPAFLAYVSQAMIEAGVANGLDRGTAQQAVAQTLVGTGRLLQNGWDPERIQKTVASPGGTTEAGLRLLSDKQVHHALHEAIRYATAKARELGKG